MARIARCHCGEVNISCEGEPWLVALCSCELCQRRTGSPIHIGAWFNRDQVTIEGTTKEFTRTTGDRGTKLTFNFCPTCGTSIWWGGTEAPFAGNVGIAGGCFADPNFPPPTVAVYDKRRHPWISTPEGIPCFAEVPRAEDMTEVFGEA